MAERILSTTQTRAFYDQFGAKQDKQGFYEDAALDDLRRYGRFNTARHVFEFGCGTGRFAESLLNHDLPETARYSGCDLSPVMIGLAQSRLAKFGDRVTLWQSDGGLALAPAGPAPDRIVSTYVLDLMEDSAIAGFIDTAAVTLAPDGLLCLVSLTNGTGPVTGLVSTLWRQIASIRPQVVGGCRPISLTDRLSSDTWTICHRSVVSSWGISSEVVIAQPTVRAG